ncbi:MAG TPA: lysylphosphatidylglycerol synthase domain-containing protein [Gaiellaceae bacterium]|nr:lysylphosphatidylglycerol synthase domain-containing protein [Gaiellaceae bacterium]
MAATEVEEPYRRPDRRRIATAVAIVGAVAVPVVAILAGWDARDWFSHAWHSFSSISPARLVPVLALQSLQLSFAAAAWVGILRYAYPGVRYLSVLACCATGVALNNVLPANAGTLVTILMLVATIPHATTAGILGAAAVEKLFYAAAGMFVTLYLFVSVGGTFDRKFGFVTRHGWMTALVAVAAVAVVSLAARVASKWLKRLWDEARSGGKILGDRSAYLQRVALPQLLAWSCKLGALALMLSAYRIPVGFHTLFSVVGGNSLANVASVTPGGIGVNQAFNVASLHGVTDAATAGAFSVGHQLVSAVWSIVLAVVLVGVAFGRGGGRLVAQSYAAMRDEAGRRGKS